MDTKFVSSAYRYFLIWGICSSLAITVCTIVDATLIGNLVGPEGLAVANISTPVFLLYALFGITVAIGANVHIGRSLGASDVDGANRIFRAQVGLGLILGVICLIPLTFKEAFFSFLGITDALYPIAEQYLTVVLWSAPAFIMYYILSFSVRTDSNPKLAAIASATVIITNIALDLVFMQVFNMGIVGASLSLCVAEMLGILILLTHFLKKRRLLRLRVSLPKLKDAGMFAINGFGVGSKNIFDALVMLVFNGLFLRFGEAYGALYIAVYGVIYTIGTIPGAVFDGASLSLSTVTSFFVGESDTDGILAVRKKALFVSSIGGAIFALLFVIFADFLLKFFGITDPSSIPGATAAMRIFAISIIFTGINTAITAFWQSIGRAKLAGAMSVIRNLLLVLALGALIIPSANVIGLAITYVCTEFLCSLVILLILACSSSKKYVKERYAPKGKCFEKSYVIKTESMSEICEDVNLVCEKWDVGMKQSFVINFVCEELLLNLIKFGLEEANKKKKYYVSIKLMEKDGEYVLRIRDNVRVYNPFDAEGDEIDSGVLKLIQKKTKYCDYQRKMMFNYLYMVI